MEEKPHPTLPRILAKALAIWLILIVAEVLHGIALVILLMPYVGDFWSNRIGVFTGSIILLVIAAASLRWIGANHPAQLLMVGFLWFGLTLAFEMLLGRFVLGASWERLTADYVLHGGLLLSFGLLFLVLSLLIVGKGRGVRT